LLYKIYHNSVEPTTYRENEMNARKH